METTYLIQRLRKPYKGPTDTLIGKLAEANPFAFGGGLRNGGLSKEAMKLLSPLFQFDYMGSAEFEFGAVPKTIAKIVDNIKDYTVNYLVFGKKSIGYLCHKDHEEVVRTTISKLAADDYGIRLKEPAMVKSVIDGREYYDKIIGWLELDNGYFFFIDDGKDEDSSFQKLLKLFGKK